MLVFSDGMPYPGLSLKGTDLEGKLYCWYDNTAITDRIYSIPMSYDTNNNIWEVQGVFCCLEHVKAYMTWNMLYEGESSFSLFTLMCEDVYNVYLPVDDYEERKQPPLTVYEASGYNTHRGLSNRSN